MLRSKYVFLFFLFSLILASTSCQSEHKNSVLVLAFDHLPAESVTCSDEKGAENSGFAILCKESVRFTHAYTTSLQPAAAMGSLLTGKYPFQHGLHRSFDRLSEKSELISKLAFENNLRTSFFSGGPSILKKTGLSNYFENFDDSGVLTQKNYFKNLKLQVEDFFDWYDEDPKPFFSVIYNSDLELTKNDDTTTFEKVDESLAVLIQQLKNRKMWESTTLMLVGLNGVNKYQRYNETNFHNLHSENTRVVSLVKKARAKGDEGVYWKNDTVIQLADLGLYLKKIVSKKNINAENQNLYFKNIDISEQLAEKLAPADTASEANINNNLRPILIEAPNTWTKNLTSLLFVVVQNHELFIDTKQPMQYNTLVDLLETTNIFDKKNTNLKTLNTELSAIKKQLQLNEIYEYKFLQIASTDKLISFNLQLENMWGLFFMKNQ